MKWDLVFSYDKQSGRLLWKGGKKGRGCVEGKEAGTNAHHGYRAEIRLEFHKNHGRKFS